VLKVSTFGRLKMARRKIKPEDKLMNKLMAGCSSDEERAQLLRGIRRHATKIDGPPAKTQAESEMIAEQEMIKSMNDFEDYLDKNLQSIMKEVDEEVFGKG
jgi:hypothetical protein